MWTKLLNFRFNKVVVQVVILWPVVAALNYTLQLSLQSLYRIS